jgi:hypothetical protein
MGHDTWSDDRCARAECWVEVEDPAWAFPSTGPGQHCHGSVIHIPAGKRFFGRFDHARRREAFGGAAFVYPAGCGGTSARLFRRRTPRTWSVSVSASGVGRDRSARTWPRTKNVESASGGEKTWTVVASGAARLARLWPPAVGKVVVSSASSHRSQSELHQRAPLDVSISLPATT